MKPSIVGRGYVLLVSGFLKEISVQFDVGKSVCKVNGWTSFVFDAIRPPSNELEK